MDPRIERTLAAVLDAALRLLQAGGPDAVTHAQVATEAGVSRTTVYKHFPSRADLLRATIEQYGRPLDLQPSGHLRDDLRGLLTAVVTDLADERRSRAFAAMMERATCDPEVASVRNALVCEGLAVFRQILERAIAEGVLRPDLDIDLAVAGFLGTVVFRRFMIDDPVRLEEVDHIVDTFLDAYGART
jgi:AcrR family transcriptional regulator